MRRGGEPLINTISGTADYSGFVGEYDLDYGISVGNLWFDTDTNNDGNRDSSAELSNFWHFDPNTPVTAGKTDLYSVALSLNYACAWCRDITNVEFTNSRQHMARQRYLRPYRERSNHR